MIKFFGWLLVPLLPLVGLLIGQCFKSERKPRWLTNYGFYVQVLGHVEGGQTLLVVEDTAKGEQTLSGIDIETGKTRFQLSLTTELLDAKANQFRMTKLSSNGKYVIFVADDKSQEKKQHIILFDWQERKVSHRFEPSPNEFVTSVSLTGTILAACGSNSLTLWNIDSPESPNTIPWGNSSFPVYLSNDATLVCQKQIEHLVNTFRIQLDLYDLKNRRKLPSIHGELFNVVWAPDAQSFSAIGYDAIRETFVRREFIRSQDNFKEVPEQDHEFNLQGNVISDQHYTIIASTERDNIWRKKISKALGPTFTPLMNRLWPDGQTLHLFDRSARLVHCLKHPLGSKAFTSLKINSHPQAKGIALSDTQWITYWDFESVLAWQPITGLSIGLMLATLLAWKLLRQKSNRLISATSSRTSSGIDVS